jgi:hypothetical protein
MKNGPEIIDFRPILESRATVANRRLQPLGHLTDPVSIRPTMSCGKEIVPAIVPEIWQLSLPRAKSGTVVNEPAR